MAQPDMDSLTARQRDVAERLLNGEKPSDIARALRMRGANGVYQHRRRLEERGFRFPKTTGGRGRPRRLTAPSRVGKVVTNGNLVHLLGDVREAVAGKAREIEEALVGNIREREIIESEMKEREQRLLELKQEEEQLGVTQQALEAAEETIPA